MQVLGWYKQGPHAQHVRKYASQESFSDVTEVTELAYQPKHNSQVSTAPDDRLVSFDDETYLLLNKGHVYKVITEFDGMVHEQDWDATDDYQSVFIPSGARITAVEPYTLDDSSPSVGDSSDSGL